MSSLWKYLFRFLHDERVIHRMSESRPVRIAARLVASIFMQSKAITQDPALKNLDPKAIKSAASNLSKEAVKTLKEAKEEIKRGLK